MDMEFEQYIKSIRKRKGLSQIELAEQANIKAPYLSKIEKGRVAAPSEEVLIRLAAVLDEDPYQMIVNAGKIPKDFQNVILTDEKVFQYLKSKVKKQGK
jgi:transcriptional regulator with XRE-family HTH domain